MSTFQLKIYFILTSLLDQVLKTDVTTLLKVINKDTVYGSVSLTFWISMGNFASFKNVSLLISLFCPRLIRAVYFFNEHQILKNNGSETRVMYHFTQKFKESLFVLSKVGCCLQKRCLSCKKEFPWIWRFLSKTYLYRECTGHCYCTKAAKLFSGTASVILLCIFSVTWVHRGW